MGEGRLAVRAALVVELPGGEAFVAEDVAEGTRKNHCFFEGAGANGLVFEGASADWAG